MATCPTREDLLDVLEKLCTGKSDREDVAAWAVSIIDDDTIRVSDQAVWRVLQNLGSVDLPAPDREYLYVEADFQDWATSLREA